MQDRVNNLLLATNPLIVGVAFLAAYALFTLPHFVIATFIYWWYVVAWLTFAACFYTPTSRKK